MAGLWDRLKKGLLSSFAKGNRVSSQRRLARRKIRLELLESRQLMAADIQGVVYHDANNDGIVGSAETRLSGIPIQLFLDNGDGVLGNTDTLKATATSGANGSYSLSAATAGTYFVVQNSEPAGFVQRQNQRIQKVTLAASDIAIADKLVLDTFNTTQQVVNASFPGATPNSSSLTAPESVGGERDVQPQELLVSQPTVPRNQVNWSLMSVRELMASELLATMESTERRTLMQPA